MFVCKSCCVSKPQSDYRMHKRGYRVGKCRECERAYQRQLSQRDPEKYRQRKRESMARQRAANPEKMRARERAWWKANRDRNAETMRAYAARRFFWTKAMKLRGNGRGTPRQLAALWKAQRGRCALTGRRLDRSAQLDHKIPRARGGGDSIGNLQWLCESVNLAKRDLTDAEFLALCGNVMAWIGRRIAQVDAVISEREAA